MGPQHDTVAWEPANIPSLPLHLGGTGLHFPAPLVFGWHHISCQRNVGGSDTCHVRLIWLNMRCISLHILPLPAHWVTPGWPFCRQEAQDGKVIRWKQLGSLQHSLEESCLTQEECDVRSRGQPSASWPWRRSTGREQACVRHSHWSGCGEWGR